MWCFVLKQNCTVIFHIIDKWVHTDIENQRLRKKRKQLMWKFYFYLVTGIYHLDRCWLIDSQNDKRIANNIMYHAVKGLGSSAHPGCHLFLVSSCCEIYRHWSIPVRLSILYKDSELHEFLLETWSPSFEDAWSFHRFFLFPFFFYPFSLCFSFVFCVFLL